MLPSGDLLKLHVQSEAEKFLKPWWDVVTDYLTLVLVMVTVVCAVVGLYAPGPVCIPVVRCPAQNSSLSKIATCAIIRNPSQNGGNSVDFATVAVQFTNQNMFHYINSECSENIFWMIRFFPNVLIVMVGCCLICSVAWFVIKSPILELFIDLLCQCYQLASTMNNSTSTEPDISEGASTSQELRTTLKTKTTPEQHAKPVECATAEDRNRVKTKLQKFVQDFEKNDTTKCQTFFSIKHFYIIISVVQAMVVVVSFSILVWLMDEKMNRQYECNIDEIISGLVYDHFVCSYSIIKFYLFGAGVVSSIIAVHTVLSFLKLVSTISLKWVLETEQFERINNLNIKSLDLKFLLNLVALSNPAYLKPFCEMYEEINSNKEMNSSYQQRHRLLKEN
ncbi:Hypothetical predicted protein [Paramuricea clavata]|uniref:LRRC8 pannexin-like TM region domain-containing protein n=1 Tax=Paramuricea clavata TaxID=317549 RepID=A0A6S7JQS5_PARCT|nr:Hypothetical predicted protein [Paramuricea clavata]